MTWILRAARLGCVAAIGVMRLQGVEGQAPTAALRLFSEGCVSPVILVPVPDGSGRFLVGDQVGVVHVVDHEGRRAPGLFLDLRSRMTKLNQGFDERGLLGLEYPGGFAWFRSPAADAAAGGCPKDRCARGRVAGPGV